MRRYPLLIMAIMLILTSCTANESTTSQSIIGAEATARIDSTLNSFVETGAVAGTSALIFEDGEEVYFNAFGYADRGNQVPMDRNTIVQIFSMTKPITGVALMTLYEEGAFQLDEPVDKYLPEFSDLQVFEGLEDNGDPILVEPGRALTIRDLTRHTSGFANDTGQEYVGPLLEQAAPMNRENTLTQFAEKLGSLPLVFHPGEEWYYGPSVDVQAVLVERLSGQPFDEYVREHILDPLGMNETRYFVPEGDRERLAATYRSTEGDSLARVPDEQAKAFNTNRWPLTPGGWGYTSTLDDYMTFAQMLVHEGELNGEQILKPETVKLMATNHLSEDVTERRWLPSKGQVGFGIDFAVRLRPPASAEENNGVVGEFFWDGAASTLFWVDPKNELTAVFFVQKFPFDGRLHKDFRDAVYGSFDQTEL
ncbi:beta-lactamase family protein [Aliifodinibius sp. S!AR15-10]|uniref:serine hydrolase domain-containing protein n=1 Tax=Aliifodinibius sp. S!AR15-10 TaxID=2950437 RepID=UPI0028631E0E|nr:serine hydrolase domain-containing protein [Aliifodinibius sp. S!AR15-10]MDR8389545.1 beta-lactamase family protein [Aliifodinibius sp. S!AR15-10]